jgi:hypothetical protein
MNNIYHCLLEGSSIIKKEKDELMIEFTLGNKHHYALGQEVLKLLLIP